MHYSAKRGIEFACKTHQNYVFSPFDSGAYNRLQFLLAVSVSHGRAREAFRQSDDSNNSNGGEYEEKGANSYRVTTSSVGLPELFF